MTQLKDFLHHLRRLQLQNVALDDIAGVVKKMHNNANEALPSRTTH